MEQNQAQNNNQPFFQQPKQPRLHVLGMFLGFLLILFLLTFVNYFSFLPSYIYGMFPFLSFLPHLTRDIPSQNLETCNVRAKDFSLVYDATDTGTIITGQYRGFIQTMKTSDNITTITIVSPDGREKHMFAIKSTIPLYDAVHATKISIDDLQPNTYIGIDFNCDKSQGGQFTIINAGIQQQ